MTINCSTKIIGYQVQDQHGQHWADRPSYEVLSKPTAIRDLRRARAENPEMCYLMIAILDGDIEEPVFEKVDGVEADGVLRLLDYREASCLLAGLRILQDMIEDGALEEYPRKLPHFDDVEPPTSEEIDALCEQFHSVECILGDCQNGR